MARKKKINWTVIFILIGIGVLIYGGTQGWFKSITSSVTNSYSNQMQAASAAPTSNYYVSVHFTMNTVCTGDESTGVIESNMPAAQCTVYSNTGDGYKYLGNAILNAAGTWSNTGEFNTAGIMIVKAICILDGHYATSNEATITINDCGSPDPIPDSNPTCVDSDGGSVKTVSGTCSEAQPDGTWTGYDVCESAVTLTEWSCDNSDECRSIVMTCDSGYYCFGGACLTGSSACAASCQSNIAYNFDTGACFAPDMQLDATAADTCVRNHGDLVGAYGCTGGLVCCCR